MGENATRIAFVVEVETAYSRRLAEGISRFAAPNQGFITRDFVVGEKPVGTPESFEAWAPDGVVSFVSAEHDGVFNAMGEGKRPIVNLSRGAPRTTRGVVVAAANAVYEAVHEHFTEIARQNIAQFVLGETPGGANSRDRYQKFARSAGIECHSFTLEDEPDDLGRSHLHSQVDPRLTEWLTSLPDRTGVFSQQSFAGPLLCRACELLGIPVPGRVAIIGIDGFDVALRTNPPLTTIRLPAEAVGYRAAELVNQMLAGERPPTEIVRVPGAEAIVRGSTVRETQTGCDIAAALTFIEEYACEGISVGDVVAHTQGVSRVTFYKRFVRATGVMPAAAISARKLAKARRLLAETRLSIGTVSGMCGFRDELYFSQVFRKAESVAPSDYRKLHLRH